ncbi:hypothetical protein BFJ63_vAg15091 [Fusarium oxysporum f. sp. narcissi]|uniref:NmrA-like domain-containing protein n=4 Tax=Fusarium oxysporum TaxID=5507 RepID=A0A420MD37_FUSOX|nr:hypothetical protein AU210_012523 [Fusarium oxysporum f. sp. radicis-cucumerinum]RKK10297.1 hypothetical protein BFJ65_g15595 [Fusarium oxysporum f. sp. cepae]RKK65977.1 hypothetical protein BFJ69_g15820 [Fusarium oxysporum]RYC82023.1 hypothetical protein BFJ63_vAg15091 [Fusarium oxysporum f. sp. narcissi]RKK30703.1 hypothetical protein BFJ66_g16185 [Fusarium oxysporum f. sp. cepae]
MTQLSRRSIALVGPGELAHYLLEELAKQHDVLVLTRSSKNWILDLNVSQQLIKDYSAESVLPYLQNREVLISTLSITDSSAIDVHLGLLDACTRSKSCKKFIPSEFTGNIRDEPMQPIFYYETHEPIREALRQQDNVAWTLFCNGWFMDYVVPASNRHFKDGQSFAMNWKTKVIKVYGKGTHVFDLTCGRDVGKALAELVKYDEWEEYTFIRGETISWQGLFDVVHRRDPTWTKQTVPFAQSLKLIVDNGEDKVRGQLEVYAHSDGALLPDDDVQAQRAKYFQGIKFRSLEEFLDEAEAHPNRIL